MTDPLQHLALDDEYRRRTIEALEDDLDQTMQRALEIAQRHQTEGLGGRAVDAAGKPLGEHPPTLLDMAKLTLHAATLESAIAELEAP